MEIITKEKLQIDLRTLIVDTIKSLNEQLKTTSELDLIVNINTEDSKEHDNQVLKLEFDEMNAPEVETGKVSLIN